MAHRPSPPVLFLAALVLVLLASVAPGCDSGVSSDAAPLEAPTATPTDADEAEPAPAPEPLPEPATPERVVGEDTLPAGEETDDPIGACRQAMARGESYTQCIIERLEGRAETAREREALIESYRASGNMPSAIRHMQSYVRRYPGTSKARNYRQILTAHGLGHQ